MDKLGKPFASLVCIVVAHSSNQDEEAGQSTNRLSQVLDRFRDRTMNTFQHRQGMAMYLQGDSNSPTVVRKPRSQSFPRKANGRTKHMFVRGETKDEGDSLIRTSLHNRSDNSEKDYGGVRVRLNISGLIYETRLQTLKRYPSTLLGDEELRGTFFDEERGEYFFDRDRQTFDSILRFYQTGGILIKPNNVPEDIFYSELNFYKIDQFLHKQEEDEMSAKQTYEAKLPKGKKMRKVWRLMEEPASSIGAKIISILSVTVIFLSIWSFCIETLPSSKELLESVCVPINQSTDATASPISYNPFTSMLWNTTTNDTVNGSNIQNTDQWTTTASYARTTSTTKPPCRVDLWQYPFFVIETFCVICFTLEVVVRFVVTPNKVAFIKSPLNVIDIAAILPYFIQLAVDIHTGSVETSSSDDSLSSLVVLRILRLVRILRVFKLSRYSTKLRVLGRTLIASVGELSILVFFIFLAMILFSTVVYFIESTSGPGNKFDSIPASFWWAVVTMTTVGYGDVVPRTVLGKIVGFLCAITGVLCIALPVPSIVNNFVKQLEEAENPLKKGQKYKEKKKHKNLGGERILTVKKKGNNSVANHSAVNVE